VNWLLGRLLSAHLYQHIRYASTIAHVIFRVLIHGCHVKVSGLFAGIQADTMAAIRSTVLKSSLFLLGDLLKITWLYSPQARGQKSFSFHYVASKTWFFLCQVLWFCTGFCFACKPCPRSSSARVAECWIRFSW
jgi:hypothetical protein